MRQAFQDRSPAGRGPAVTEVAANVTCPPTTGPSAWATTTGRRRDGHPDDHDHGAAAGPTQEQTLSEIAYLTRALKAPTLRDSVERLAERARAENWTHEQFLAACLQREVSARDSHGGEGRIRAARFPARKALEEFDFDHQRSLKRETIAHLGTLDFITAKENAIFLGPPGTGKTMLAIGLGIRACQAGHRVAFATAAEWVARLAAAHHARPAAGRDHQTRPHPAADHRRGRLHPVRSRSRQPVLPTRLRPLRTGQPHRHQQQTLRPLGRGVRRRRGRRRDDRPARPPRRGHLPQGRQLPAAQPRPRPRPRRHQQRHLTITAQNGCTAAVSTTGTPLTRRTARSRVTPASSSTGAGSRPSLAGSASAQAVKTRRSRPGSRSHTSA